jgi:DNA-binding Lrp family transcriptional regulator
MTADPIAALRADIAEYRAENARIIAALEGIAFPKQTQADRARELGISQRALRARMQRARAKARVKEFSL